jgi:hypothetical protein
MPPAPGQRFASLWLRVWREDHDPTLLRFEVREGRLEDLAVPVAAGVGIEALRTAIETWAAQQ